MCAAMVAGFVIGAEAGEFVRAVAGAEAGLEAAVGQDVDEGGIFDDAHGMVQRHDHHAGA
jgi:hypothetical protein